MTSADSKRETGAEPILIGRTDTGSPITVDRFQHQKHTAAFGKTGSGKTYRVPRNIQQDIEWNIKEIVEESEQHILLDPNDLF